MSQDSSLAVFLYDKLNEILQHSKFTELGLIVSHQSINQLTDQSDDEDFSWLPSDQSIDDLPDDVTGAPFHVNIAEGALGVAMWAIPRLFKQANTRFRIARETLNQSIDQSSKQSGNQSNAQPIIPLIDSSIIQSITNTSRILLMINADHLSAWNARKRIVLSQLHNRLSSQSLTLLSGPSNDASIKMLTDELEFVSFIQSKHVKSGETWHHRLWCVERLMEQIQSIDRTNNDSLFQLSKTSPSPTDDGQSNNQLASQAAILLSSLICTELSMIERAAERYPKLYYAWNHRLFLLQTMHQSISQSSNQSINQLFSDQISAEWSSVTRWNDRHLSDHSGWWFRYQLLTHTKARHHHLKQSKDQSASQFKLPPINQPHHQPNDSQDHQPACSACDSISEEFHYISDLIDRCPGHESMWKYRRYLSFLTLDSIHFHHSYTNIESSISQFMDSLKTQTADESASDHRYASTTDETREIMQQFLIDEADWCRHTVQQSTTQTSDANDLKENSRWALAHQTTLERRMQMFVA